MFVIGTMTRPRSSQVKPGFSPAQPWLEKPFAFAFAHAFSQNAGRAMKIINGLLVMALAGPALPPGVAPHQAGVAQPSSADWMSETDDVLELKLAHEEKGRPDGGTLRIDSTKRLLLWEGIPGEFGCKLRVEASFDEVDDISVSELAGFVLALKRDKNKKLVLIPRRSGVACCADRAHASRRRAPGLITAVLYSPERRFN